MEAIIAPIDEKPLYFDYQASTPVDRKVLAAMLPYFETEFGNPHSGEHLHGQSAFAAIEASRNKIADCLGADGEDIVFTSGASEANNLAILGTARSQPCGRNKILVSEIEHSSVLEAACASGLEVINIPVDGFGQVDLEWLRSALSDEVLLVSVGFVNNEIGTIQDIARISCLVQDYGAFMHVDAAQALTSTAIDVCKYPIDFMSLSSHKAYGPKGVGALYIAPGKRAHLRPLIFGGGQEHGLRAGTLPTPLCIGFGEACSLIRNFGAAERQSIIAKRDYFFGLLVQAVPGIELVGHPSQRHPGNLSVKMPVNDARDLVQLLCTNMSFSTGSACHSGSELPSHVLTSCGLSTAEARSVARLGIGRSTSIADCDKAAQFIHRGVLELQKHGVRKVS